jgi:hypothetical protein
MNEWNSEIFETFRIWDGVNARLYAGRHTESRIAVSGRMLLGVRGDSIQWSLYCIWIRELGIQTDMWRLSSPRSNRSSTSFATFFVWLVSASYFYKSTKHMRWFLLTFSMYTCVVSLQTEQALFPSIWLACTGGLSCWDLVLMKATARNPSESATGIDLILCTMI